MAVSSRKSSGRVLRSNSPSGRSPSTPPAFASSTSTFSSPASGFLRRSTSPTRLNFSGASSVSSPSVRFTFDRPGSPSRSISALKKPVGKALNNQKRTCMCSPTNHPGSFRCNFHKNLNNQTSSFPSNRLNARRSAMTNSLVRIGTVEGDLVRRALVALIRPSSHQQKRRTSFQARPSRLSIMSKAED
ncbi:hypothetical protein LguiA_018731 [Lonicera macranthoides]